MLDILKIEINRSFKNKLFLVSLILSSALVVWFSIERLPVCIEKNNTFSTQFIPDDFLEISFTNWLGSHNIFLQQNIFYLILPLLVTIPYGSSFFDDINSGYIKSISVRASKKDYLVAKYVSVFISGGVSAIFPMILSFIISSAFLPTMLPESSYIYTNIWSVNKWADLFFKFPMIYVFLYMLLLFIFSGIVASMSLLITYCSFKSFLPLVFPFFIYICSSLLFELINMRAFSPRNFLTPNDVDGTTFSVVIICILFFIISFVPYYFIGVKKDVL